MPHTIMLHLGGAVANHLKGLALRPATDVLMAVLANEAAFSFAREAVRDEFESVLQPAAYDHVIRKLQLTRNDVIRYYQSYLRNKECTESGLGEYIQKLLHEKLRGWIHNVPSEEVLDRLVRRFYEAYEAHYLTTDPAIGTLHLISASDETLKVLHQLRTDVAELANKAGTQREPVEIFDELLLFMVQMNLASEVVERGPDHLDIEVAEHGTILPTMLYIVVLRRIPEIQDIEDLLSRSRTRGHGYRLLVVAPRSPSPEIFQYAHNRAVSLLTIRDLQQLVLERQDHKGIVLGEVSSVKLAESYNIHEVYVEPDGVLAHPNLTYLPTEQRTPMKEMLSDFLHSEDQVMIVLGDYGSGKSAWCANVTRQLTIEKGSFLPVYVALRHLPEAADLPRVIQHAVRLATAYRRGDSRVVVLADGFDEMPNAMDPREKRSNMLRLLAAVPKTAKLIVTARTSYFRGLDDFWHLFDLGQTKGLWNRLADYIPQDKRRPRVRAVALHSFNNTQIEHYVQELARVQTRDKDFVRMFFQEMARNDPQGVYRQMARNPLYLFLLFNTEPWNDSSVESIADVMGILVRYWLERDVEKGTSRWLLHTQDRLDFMRYLAWRMHHRNEIRLTYDTFSISVREFYHIEEASEDSQSIVLDLQTTGIFGSTGGTVYFLLPAVMDYFIAQAFGDSSPLPQEGRLPSVDQGRMWLALVETKKASGELLQKDWFGKSGIPIDEKPSPIIMDPRGLLYGDKRADYKWPVTNAADPSLRAILNHVLYPPKDKLPNAIRIRMLNKYGLHARPVAEIIKAYKRWPWTSDGKIYFRYGGHEAYIGHIMRMMFLAVTPGAVFQVVYEGLERKEVEAFLASLGGRRVSETDVDWELESETE